MSRILLLLITWAFYFVANAQSSVPFVYTAENTGASCTPPPLPTIDQLPIIKPLPDPFVFAAPGKGRSTAFSDWACRRNEIKRQIENYEIGIKPPKPDTMSASFVPSPNGGRLTVVIVRHGRAMTLTSNISFPSAGSGPFPAVIGMALAPGAGGSTGSLPSSIFTSRNIASIEYVHNQVTTYAAGQDAPKVNDPFYILYPELIDNGQYSAWIWGVSRLIDGIELVQKSSPFILPIDLKHLAVTGCSYAGKMALFAGAFDERIALTIAQESGGGGAPAWRVSHGIEPNGTVEKIDNTDDSWFMKSMRQFSGDNVYKLPHDHHLLMAMIAPRALLVTGNTDFTWLSNRSTFVTSMATKEIYKTLGIGDRFGFYIDGQHGHCAIPASQVPAIGAFVDKFLLDKATVNTDTVMIRPKTPGFDTLDYARWYNWWGTGNPIFNSNPVVSKAQAFTINDRAVNGTEAGTASATDRDGNALQNWKITGGTGAPFFSINAATGVISVTNRGQMDFANVRSYTLLVTVSDGMVNSQPETIIIHLTNYPVVTPSQVFHINDWIADGAVIGTVAATDRDPNTTLQSWKITGGTGASVFAIDAANGQLKVMNSNVINSGQPATYTVNITVSDGTYTSSASTVNIAISDKVYVCHSGNTLYVKRSDAAKHLAHGDRSGVCETNGIAANMQRGPLTADNNGAAQVYPNPVRDAIYVNLGANPDGVTLIQLVDISGKTLRQVRVAGESQIRIAREGLTGGYYFIRLHGKSIQNQKVVVQ